MNAGGPIYEGERVDPLPDDPDSRLRASVVMGMIALGASGGIPMAELLGLSRLSPAELADPDATVQTPNAVRVLRRVETVFPGRAISLQLVAHTPNNAFGLVELAALSAETVGEAVDLMLRYIRLTSSHLHMWLERRDDFVTVRLRHQTSLEALRHPVEMGVGHAHRMLQRAGAPVADFVEVHFGHPSVGPAEPYEDHFGCPVHFESFGHGLVMRREILDRPIQHGDPVLSRSLVARLERKLPEGDDELATLRRDVAEHARPAHYRASTVARRMGRSLRSLQRDASRLGTTLSQVIEDVRIARARELLEDDSLSVDEVGFLVDYSERAAFSRAFKRATGETPVGYRRRVAK